ncbi:ABC transporter substrate-binding protein [Streptomyces sp. SP18CS02]|uniref:ABC transporter substrate-binding protein n=1 Tax=Streptomyces sp. SP18CS02 TaxID=3002531 RepID=UPI002E77F2EF|nr:ABC transporter substrate-binding protein [Streptomyces sp. SP18CS02]MEE1751995.1 ABC transporter substrate-binding protein [Streptomyces sp. SP18CS02]
MRRPRRRFIVGLLLAPLLTGCFASGEGDSPATGSSDSGECSRLRVAMAFPPAENFSPYGEDAYHLSRLGVSEGLTQLDANGSAAPALAQSWNSENGGRSWLFTLRDAKFQDGGEVTPDAVAIALTRAAQIKPVPVALAGVKLSAEPVGDHQVRVRTEAPDPVLPLRLSNPRLAVFSPKAYAKAGTVNPVGTATGPFALKKITGAAAASLNRFDGYWGGRPQAAGIDATFIADGTARANALRTGRVDIAETLPIAQLPSLDKKTVHEKPTARTVVLNLNTKSGPFADPGLRAAAREAIDPTVLARDVYEGYAEPGQGVFGPALNWAAGKRIEQKDRAKATDPDGTAVTIATYSNRPELPEVAQVLQQQLQKAGFTVKVEVRDLARFDSDALAGKFDATVYARNVLVDTGDPVSVLASDYTCEGSNNQSQLCDRKVDQAVARAATVTDTGQRQDAVMAAEAALLATDAVVPLVHMKTAMGLSTSVEGTLRDPYERLLVGTGTRR